MNTRLTVDLHDPQLMRLLKLEASQERQSMQKVIVQALHSYFSSKRENRAVVKLAERAFAEWDNPKDSEYDHL